ncbi:hypothetical protein BD777DRAFT_8751 [Yarrowia lipolytica]|uniref:Uncharacterized protein n=1 Tax=Yarrowia lipolytica TaxID=4952 RepID=A0A1D8NC99_YARLL|nr:hypothetical protein YALI1_C30760g [Yarrowia lipolytica]RMI96185.1 hypothetical protein BD777DRAFT_8751 [Yarrowia lipolytica]
MRPGDSPQTRDVFKPPPNFPSRGKPILSSRFFSSLELYLRLALQKGLLFRLEFLAKVESIIMPSSSAWKLHCLGPVMEPSAPSSAALSDCDDRKPLYRCLQSSFQAARSVLDSRGPEGDSTFKYSERSSCDSKKLWALTNHISGKRVSLPMSLICSSNRAACVRSCTSNTFTHFKRL